MKMHQLANIAQAKMPRVDCEVVPGAHRHNVIDGLAGDDNVGVELGVASGIFSDRMVRSGKFRLFFGVDNYEDRPYEYRQALSRVGLFQPYKLLRMSFDEALGLFDDASLDFIYVDGYAHTGEDGGKVFAEWYSKLKTGGILAGDDYSEEWPLVQWAVNSFVEQTGARLFITDRVESETYCEHPSWFVKKDREVRGLEQCLPKELLELGAMERRRVQWKRRRKRIKHEIRSRIGSFFGFPNESDRSS